MGERRAPLRPRTDSGNALGSPCRLTRGQLCGVVLGSAEVGGARAAAPSERGAIARGLLRLEWLDIGVGSLHGVW